MEWKILAHQRYYIRRQLEVVNGIMAENIGKWRVEIAEKQQFTGKSGKWSNLEGLKD